MASKPRAPSAQERFTVIVPMAVQALVITNEVTQTAAQFAPLIEPDYATLLQPRGLGAPVHDLMDSLDLSYWRMQARHSTRFVDLSTGNLRSGRTGVYLSWCLPRVYRGAITATDSALVDVGDVQGEGKKQWESRKARAGFKCETKPVETSGTQTSDENSLQFRSAPDRWIVVRQVRSKPELAKYVLVESNCIRTIDDAEMPDDVEAETCPAMDPEKPLDEQWTLRMGRSSLLTKKNLEDAQTRKYREPFNAFEMGHEFFADYAPHNMGSFSYFDDLAGIENESVNYLVVGYHSSANDSDPLTFVDGEKLLPVESGESDETGFMSNKELLDALHLTMDNQSPMRADFLQALASPANRTPTHGAIRNVRWNRAGTGSMRWPAASLQQDMYAETPIAIGTHMLDALAAYIHIALDPMDTNSANAQSVLAQLIPRVLAQGDDADSLRRAAEDAASQSFLERSEGTAWRLPKNETEDSPHMFDPTGSERKGPEPEKATAGERGAKKRAQEEHIEMLTPLNEGQLMLDTCARESAQLMQRLFGCWWNASGLGSLPLKSQDFMKQRIKAEAKQIQSRLQNLSTIIESTKTTVDKLKTEIEVLIGGGKKLEAIPTAPYGLHQDPTILVAGAKSGWPSDFNGVLPVRLAADISPKPSEATAIETWLNDILPDISEPVATLLREFELPSLSVQQNPYIAMEDMDNTQGWFPLFLEWELEYYHVPFAKWSFEADMKTGRWRYVIPSGDEGEQSLLEDQSVGQDMRVLKGRTVFLPEPGKTLRARLEQLFAKSPAKNENGEQKREELLEKVAGFEFFSAPLAGLSSHLTTLCQGHHPRPKADEAIRKILWIEKETMELLVNSPSSAQELAPYGYTTPLPLSHTSAFSPFKPVTHGQARFIKFAIVDKFGQVVSGLQLGPTGDGAMYPSISPSLACGVIPTCKGEPEDKYWPNTAVQAEDDKNGHGLCQFFQIPPRINQRARLNAHFLMPLSDADVAKAAADKPITRKVAGEWDPPVWAWLLPNFQSHGIQVYDASGDFVVEIVLVDSTTSVKVSDGPRNVMALPPATGRLPSLLKAMRQYDFSLRLFNMLAGASDSMLSSGADFDTALPAALGRPFCVADVGVSIELSAPPLTDASLLSSQSQELKLLDYEFSVALGNHTAAFDGLVGTFAAYGEIDKVATAFDRDAVQLNSTSSGTATIFRPADEHPQPLRVKPYFLSGTLSDIATRHRERLAPISVIMDPKMPIHAYSGSLFPVAELSLPRWPMDTALRSMRAFFASGPMLVPAMHALPDFQALPMDPDGKNPELGIQMPLGGGEGINAWRWLQPRLETVRGENGKQTGEKTTWSDVAIRPLDVRMNIDASVGSELVEGYVLVKGAMASKE
ncbi:hypothetical protein G7Z17_g1690 [Cylindrodendrum hubeiense]|uniref:Uncharacterized protein n=1 Tax=Cylindrodendrum hubeiense TaxID=595255 RepID=A0A9P5LL34_9HYPO|nr:hypothetical protein G7Z17_g1690 [Cylindrodendrum hubeiense]